MKAIICCPKCGNEDLRLKKNDNPYVYICDKCKHGFDSMGCGIQLLDKGRVSDGSHTFDELYHHRMVVIRCDM